MKNYTNDGQKRNYLTGREYTGRNAVILTASDDVFFLTFVQGRSLGFHLREGSKGIHLLLIDKRSGTDEEKGYFYKSAFVVFGLSCWTKNGTAIPEPIPGAAFPWADRLAEKRESKVFTEPEPKPEPKPEPIPGKTIRKTPRPVNKKSINRAYFLKSSAAFFPTSSDPVYFAITGGKAVFMTRPHFSNWIMAIINDVRGPDFTTVVDSRKAKTIIKGIDSFRAGLIGNKRVCWKEDAAAADLFDSEAFTKLFSPAGPAEVSLPAETLRSVVYASATDLVKPAFNSVCISSGAVVASDSRRLAARMINTGIKNDAIVPLNLAKNAVGTVAVYGPIVRAECEYGYTAAHLVDGQFPTWEKVIPDTKGAAVLHAPRSLFAELKSVTQGPSYKSVFRPDGCYIMDLDEKGAAYDRKVSDVSCPEPFGVNADYMLAAVRENSEILFSGAMQPIVIKTGDVIDVVMPIQIKPTPEEGEK